MRHLRSAAFVGIALATTACGHKPTPEPVTPPAAEASPPARSTVDEDAARRAAEERTRREAEEAARRDAAVLTQKVFFDYDVAAIRADQKSVLDAKVAILRADPGIQMRIEGHADDRGSTEYNLALGQQRAEVIRQYLTGFGLDGSRFVIMSWGEERPVMTGASESSWAQNRRGEFLVSGGRLAMGHDR